MPSRFPCTWALHASGDGTFKLLALCSFDMLRSRSLLNERHVVTSGPAVMDAYNNVAWPELARAAGAYPAGSFYDDLALLASNGKLYASDLIAEAHSGRSKHKRHLDATGVAWFAYVTASRVDAHDRVKDASALFNFAYTLGGPTAIRSRLAGVWLQCAALNGDLTDQIKQLRRVKAPAEVWWAAATDSRHPSISPDSDRSTWLQLFNKPLLDAELSPIALADRAGTLFERMNASSDSAATCDGPRVTVVVPVFNPDQSFLTAVRSLLLQTWSNLEVILCDDASTKNAELIQQLASEDERIKVITLEQNGGAYGARNAGVLAATGDYITFNDADDWSHPDRIRRHVESLENNSEALATISHSIRVTDDLQLTVIGRPPKRINLSSLLMRRQDFLEYFGAFDPVRRGADSEFISRFETAVGAERFAILEDPLAYVQLTPGSLSRADYRHLYTHPARVQYRANFRHWHAKNAQSKPSLHYQESVRPNFPAPSHITGIEAPTSTSVDVLMLGNLGGDTAESHTLPDEISYLNSQNYKVAIKEYLAPRDLIDRPKAPNGELAELIRLGRVEWLLVDRQVKAETVVIRDLASIRTMPAFILETIETNNVVVLATNSELQDANSSRHDITAFLKDKFNSSVYWHPALPQERNFLAHFMKRKSTSSPQPPLLPPVIDSARIELTDRAPHLGIWAPGILQLTDQDLSLWLDPIVELGFDMTIWGVASQFRSILSDSCRILNSRSSSFSEFINAIDFLVIPPTSHEQVSLDPLIWKATKEGKIVFVPSGARTNLASSVEFYRPESLISDLKALGSDASRREQHLRNAFKAIQASQRPEEYLDTLFPSRRSMPSNYYGGQNSDFPVRDGEVRA